MTKENKGTLDAFQSKNWTKGAGVGREIALQEAAMFCDCIPYGLLNPRVTPECIARNKL